MRLGVIIAALAAIAVGLIHLRRREIMLHHEIQRVRNRRVELRRQSDHREVGLARLLTPDAVARRWEEIEKPRRSEPGPLASGGRGR